MITRLLLALLPWMAVLAPRTALGQPAAVEAPVGTSAVPDAAPAPPEAVPVTEPSVPPAVPEAAPDVGSGSAPPGAAGAGSGFPASVPDLAAWGAGTAVGYAAGAGAHALARRRKGKAAKVLRAATRGCSRACRPSRAGSSWSSP